MTQLILTDFQIEGGVELLWHVVERLLPAVDISSTRSSHPSARSLSNFTERPFVFDGVEVTSLESLLQSFKFPSVEKQAQICALPGYKAKLRGRKGNKRWQGSQMLHWNGSVYPRRSVAYQALVARAFDACFDQNSSFVDDLRALGRRHIRHSMGKSDMGRTVLTEQEFVDQLNRLRKKLNCPPPRPH